MVATLKKQLRPLFYIAIDKENFSKKREKKV